MTVLACICIPFMMLLRAITCTILLPLVGTSLPALAHQTWWISIPYSCGQPSTTKNIKAGSRHPKYLLLTSSLCETGFALASRQVISCLCQVAMLHYGH